MIIKMMMLIYFGESFYRENIDLLVAKVLEYFDRDHQGGQHNQHNQHNQVGKTLIYWLHFDRDHQGGQQEGVYNSRIFVKPGTDEVLVIIEDIVSISTKRGRRAYL